MLKISRNLLPLILLATPLASLAHTEEYVADGLLSGFLHPLYGLDHMLAMVAVGLWGAQLGRPAIWVLPVAFPMLMAFGAVLGILGVAVPAVELGISLSALVLGALIALCLKLPLGVAIVVVAAFGAWHGHAHGTELPQSANALAYATGFVVSTGLLHLAGILLGTLTRQSRGMQIVRAVGASIAAVGVYLVALQFGVTA